MEDSHCKTGDSSHQEVGDAFAGFNTVHTQEDMNVQSSNELFVFLLQGAEDSTKGWYFTINF